MYYFPEQPPYLLLAVGLFIAVTSGFGLTGTLKVIVQKWRKDSAEKSDSNFYSRQLLVPFLGITFGIILFLYSGLAIFGFPTLLALGVGLPLGLLTCLLLWLQLSSMLSFAKNKGMQALDLDSLS
ncbi:hypothetical protein NIES21_03680 [Anabaenopsis circularis NIES-21]|uniref:Uncharacterized protein n=2 Tax=Nostocales TaxID=1161 RepID=A0A1Z4GAR9_9CYAN|nr:hypothetical protein [Nostoc cycadae]BAY14611.1 hypothetical protein NIES21_03680 [Anabaenopsis circularis NIES-21]GBE92302.1 hypothetical protein NCWK1_2056 [Nostoc cycadae WK-1]